MEDIWDVLAEEIHRCQKCGNRYPYCPHDEKGFSDCPRCTELHPAKFGDWIRLPKAENKMIK